MKQTSMKLIEVLKQNRLMRTPTEVNEFEKALAEMIAHPNSEDLPEYHLILDDQCQQPEVMFGLIHFLESFEVETQLQAFLNVIPELMTTAPEWTRILHLRILNDESACQIYQRLLHQNNTNKPHFIYYLLEESTHNYLKAESNS